MPPDIPFCGGKRETCTSAPFILRFKTSYLYGNYNRGSFVVMACGKSVEAFVKGSNMAQEFEQGNAAGATYNLCGLSLKQFSIDPKTLAGGVEVVPNGLTYMFDLQQQGYI